MSNYDRLSIKLGLATNKPKEKKRIAPVSEKRKKEQKEYRKLVKETAKIDDRCKVKSPVCTGKMQGFQHKVKRSPKNFLQRSNLLESCNACNLWIEENPKEAIAIGVSESKFKK